MTLASPPNPSSGVPFYTVEELTELYTRLRKLQTNLPESDALHIL